MGRFRATSAGRAPSPPNLGRQKLPGPARANFTGFSAGRHAIDVEPGAGQLNLNGTISRNIGGSVTFLPNFGTINVTGSGLSNLNGILGGWAILGTDWAALDGSSNVVAYAGYTDMG